MLENEHSADSIAIDQESIKKKAFLLPTTDKLKPEVPEMLNGLGVEVETSYFSTKL